MQIILNNQTKINNKTVVALGNFDGIHKGHQRLINNVIEQSKSKGLKSTVFTFSNHPASVVGHKTLPKLLMSNGQKERHLREMGLDVLYMIPFTREIMKLTPEEFVKDILIEKLNMKLAVVGFNYRFGHKGIGTTSTLEELGKKFGFDVIVVKPIKEKSDVISSTYIRESLYAGEVEKARKLLGRYYEIEGKVIKGKGRGRKLNFPTANIKLVEDFIVPKNGVYETKTWINGKKHKSLTSIGYNPTFDDVNQLSIETYIVDFHESIYEKVIRVEFIRYLRPEKKFTTKDELIKQMHIDLEQVACDTNIR